MAGVFVSRAWRAGLAVAVAASLPACARGAELRGQLRQEIEQRLEGPCTIDDWHVTIFNELGIPLQAVEVWPQSGQINVNVNNCGWYDYSKNQAAESVSPADCLIIQPGSSGTVSLTTNAGTLQWGSCGGTGAYLNLIPYGSSTYNDAVTEGTSDTITAANYTTATGLTAISLFFKNTGNAQTIDATFFQGTVQSRYNQQAGGTWDQCVINGHAVAYYDTAAAACANNNVNMLCGTGPYQYVSLLRFCYRARLL
jgi:hypothetical protein